MTKNLSKISQLKIACDTLRPIADAIMTLKLYGINAEKIGIPSALVLGLNAIDILKRQDRKTNKSN